MAGSETERRLEAKARNILGQDGRTASDLVAYLGPKSARMILERAERMTSDQARRRAYVVACVKRPKRIAEIRSELERRPDPYDMLMPEELREIDTEDMDTYLHERNLLVAELDVLSGERQGAYLLLERLGAKKATRLFALASKAVGSEAKLNVLLTNAAKASTKYPERYIMRAIENRIAGDG